MFVVNAISFHLTNKQTFVNNQYLIKMKTILKFGFLLLLISNQSFIQAENIQSKAALEDLTDDGGATSGQYPNSPNGEGIDKLFDNDGTTKHVITGGATAWVQYKANQYYIVTQYAITSGNDAPPRDPKSWTLEGSNDGENFVTIDSRENQDWTSRNERREFTFTNTVKYRYYRLNMTNHGVDEWGYNILQLSELEIYGTPEGGEFPTANFTVDKSVINIGEAVTFTNASTNADTYLWDFGSAGTSTETNPSVTFNSAGYYTISLKAFKGAESDLITKTDVLIVNDPNSPWANFQYPNIQFVDKDVTSEGALIYHQIVTDPEAYIKQHAREVAEMTYYKPEDVNRVDNVIYTIEWYDGISAKSGSQPNIGIVFSTQHVKTTFDNTGGDLDKVAFEIKGVLYHELTHGYQFEPQGAGSYQKGTEFYGFIEGLADYNRIVKGYHTATQQMGGHWTDGYTTTGFFYKYIAEKYDADFTKKLNATCKTINPWSHDKAFREILGRGVRDLWNEYQGNPTNAKDISFAVPYPAPFNKVIL